MSVSRNSFYNLIGAIIPLGVALVTVPIYIRLIGENRYGVLAIVWLLLGYFGVFDLGLGRATAQRIAKLKGAPQNDRANAFWTALILNAGFGLIGGVLIWPAAQFFFAEQFSIEAGLKPETLSAVPWLAAAVPMATISGVFIGALQGMEKFLILNAVSATGSVLFQILPLLVAAVFSPDLRVLLPVAISSRLLTLVALFFLCKRHVFEQGRIVYVKKEAANLLSFGGWVTVSAFISPIMVMVDRFITGAILGAKAVTYYTVPYQLAERTTIIPTALSSSLFPRFATASPGEEERLSESSLRTLIAIMTPLTALAIVLAKPFLVFWISGDFANESATVAMLLLVGFWINGLARIPHAHLQAKGRPDVVAKCHLFEVAPYVAVLYLALKHYGIVGAAFTFSLRLYIDFLLLAHLSGALRSILAIKLCAMSFLAVAFWLGQQTDVDRLYWGASCVLLVVTTLVWSYFQAPSHVRQVAKRFLIRR